MAATIMSTGQITIVDLTDQRTSSFYLTADSSKIQVKDINKNPVTFTPNYADNNLTITPSFFFGTEEQILGNNIVVYKINGLEPEASKILTSDIASKPSDYYTLGNKLVIKKNISDFWPEGSTSYTATGATILRIVATVPKGRVTDAQTGMPTQADISADIEFALIETGADGASGVGITNVTTQYGVSATQDTQPTEWKNSTTEVALGTTNKYLWVKQTTTFSDNSKKEQIYIAGTYGETGEAGAAGRSVKSITEQYYISKSDSSATGGNWVTNAPTSVEVNKYLWTRTEIVYTESDGNTTTKEYVPSTDGKCDTTWKLAVDKVTAATEAVNNLQASYDALKDQVDKAIDTWFGKEDPSSANEPESAWETEELKNQHSGDLYYNTITGDAFRYVQDNGEWTWTKLSDEALSAALKQINTLKDDVDKKVTIFYGKDYPTSAEVDDLWIKGANGDSYRCQEAYENSIKLDNTNWGTYWTLANSAVRQVDIEFAKTQSATSIDENAVTWYITSPTWEEGWYIWQRTIIKDGSNNTLSTSAPVCITSASRSITSVTNYYKRTTTNSAPETSNSDWSTTPVSPDSNNPYLWNYEKVEYTYGDPSTTVPALIGMYSADGEAGRGIESITEWYLVSSSSSGENFTLGDNGTPTESNWHQTIQATTDESPYLWNVEVTKYTSGTIYVASEPQVIGYRGVGVKSIVTYYQVSDSAKVPSTDDLSNWKTSYNEADAVSANRPYMWTFTITTYTDNSTSKTNPVIIATYAPAGEDAVYAIVESGSHTVFSDSWSGNITLTATLYVGGVEVSPTERTWSSIPSGLGGENKTLVIERKDVTNIRTFICTMRYNNKTYSDRITISDKTDPIWCEITSSNGDKFTNGNISTILTANLYHSQKGKLSDTELNSYYFNWKKYDKDGNEETFSPTFVDGAPGATGYQHKITITDNDVSSKAIFACEVTVEAPTNSSST